MPDGVFYYSLTIVLSIALITIIWAYVHRLNATLDALKTTVTELMVISKHHDKDIEELKKKKRA